MTVAVAIPCYNGDLYIGRCIEAILKQTHSPNQILVVNDGSTDGSESIINQYPVRLLRHSRNLGLSSARNTALAEADTDFIVFVDADAYASDQMLAVLLKEFEIGRVDGVGGQGIESIQKTVYDRWRGLHAQQGYGVAPRQDCPHLFGLCMAYRCTVLRSVGGFNPLFRTNAEDVDIGYRLVDAGFKLIYTPAATVHHQRRDDHTSLRKMMYQWYFWGGIARRKNNRSLSNLVVGTFRRLVLSDTWRDLIDRRDMDLVKLDIELTTVKLRAIRAAAEFDLAKNDLKTNQ